MNPLRMKVLLDAFFVIVILSNSQL